MFVFLKHLDSLMFALESLSLFQTHLVNPGDKIQSGICPERKTKFKQCYFLQNNKTDIILIQQLHFSWTLMSTYRLYYLYKCYSLKPQASKELAARKTRSEQSATILPNIKHQNFAYIPFPKFRVLCVWLLYTGICSLAHFFLTKFCLF